MSIKSNEQKVETFLRVFNAYELPSAPDRTDQNSRHYLHARGERGKSGVVHGKGGNMEKIVKITSIEEKQGKKGAYWHVHTSPALIDKKALFLHKEEQVALLEVNKSYKFDFFTNEGGFIQVKSFDETIDVNDDMPTPAPKRTQDNKNKAFALSYAKDTVMTIYAAKIRAGQEVPDLHQMEIDIITMAGAFAAVLEK